MPRKSSNKRKNNKRKTRKQKMYVMRGCSKNSKTCKSMTVKKQSSPLCPKCGPNCHCGPKCNCPHNCPGNCYLNRQKGGSGCGPCGCPFGGLSYKQMNQFGGDYSMPLNGEPILGVGQNGGLNASGLNASGCEACGLKGGSFYKPAAPIPGPFVGSSWGAAFDKWPGINGIGGDSNYLANYKNVITNDPQQQMSMSDAGYTTRNSMVGGYKYDKKSSSIKSNSNSKTKSNSKSKSIKGGSLIPQDFANLGSDFTFNLKSAYNALNGYKAPVNPLPYKDQLYNQMNNRKILI